MTIWEALLYGLVQGLTEYLPISSSAHLILLPAFMGTPDPGLAFDVFLHVGTLLSTLVFFWKDWLKIFTTLPLIGAFLKNKVGVAPPQSTAYSWKLLAVATLPALLAGAAFHGPIRTVLRGPEVVAWTLAVGGVALFFVDRFAIRKLHFEAIRMPQALWIGIAQCLALIPGVSRSGATITGARLLGLDRWAAAKFSFLMSAPVIFAATVFELRDWDQLVASGVGVTALWAATLGSFLSGMLAIGGLLTLLRRFTFLPFALYRVGLGLTVWKVLVSTASH